VTWIYELVLDILKCIPKNEVSRSMFSEVTAGTDRQTETQTHAIENITTPHLPVVLKAGAQAECHARVKR